MLKSRQPSIIKLPTQQRGRVPLIYIFILLIIIVAIVIAGFISSNFFSELANGNDGTETTVTTTTQAPTEPATTEPATESKPDMVESGETLDQNFDEQIVDQPEQPGKPSKVQQPTTLARLDDLGTTEEPANVEVIQDRASELYDDKPSADLISQWVLTDNLVSRFVTVINGLAEHDIVYRQMIVPTPSSNFVAKQVSDGLVIGENNYARYITYINMLTNLKTSTLVATYKVYLPRFEEEFALLGYGSLTFATRTKQALQVLLDTSPSAQSVYYLKEPDAFGRYEFLDEGNEAQDPIQKLYARMGKANELRLKSKVADILKALNQ